MKCTMCPNPSFITEFIEFSSFFHSNLQCVFRKRKITGPSELSPECLVVSSVNEGTEIEDSGVKHVSDDHITGTEKDWNLPTGCNGKRDQRI